MRSWFEAVAAPATACASPRRSAATDGEAPLVRRPSSSRRNSADTTSACEGIAIEEHRLCAATADTPRASAKRQAMFPPSADGTEILEQSSLNYDVRKVAAAARIQAAEGALAALRAKLEAEISSLRQQSADDRLRSEATQKALAARLEAACVEKAELQAEVARLAARPPPLPKREPTGAAALEEMRSTLLMTQATWQQRDAAWAEECARLEQLLHARDLAAERAVDENASTAAARCHDAQRAEQSESLMAALRAQLVAQQAAHDAAMRHAAETCATMEAQTASLRSQLTLQQNDHDEAMRRAAAETGTLAAELATAAASLAATEQLVLHLSTAAALEAEARDARENMDAARAQPQPIVVQRTEEEMAIQHPPSAPRSPVAPSVVSRTRVSPTLPTATPQPPRTSQPSSKSPRPRLASVPRTSTAVAPSLTNVNVPTGGPPTSSPARIDRSALPLSTLRHLDEMDAMWRRALEDCDYEEDFAEKIIKHPNESAGCYSINGHRVRTCVAGGKLQVRKGGGIISVESFLEKYAPRLARPAVAHAPRDVHVDSFAGPTKSFTAAVAAASTSRLSPRGIRVQALPLSGNRVRVGTKAATIGRQ